jgi:hypothetical protein
VTQADPFSRWCVVISMRRLPVIPSGTDALDAIEIPVPCEVPWESMGGNDQVRHCGACRQNVYNVAGFTRAEALHLLSSRAGRVCLRIFRRPDGTVVTSDCRERLRAARKRGWLVFAGALLIVAWAQICAQVVGLMGLRRLTGAGLTGAPLTRPVAALRPSPVARPLPMMGAPPPLPMMGEVAPPIPQPTMGRKGPAITGHVKLPTKHSMMGKPVVRD